MKLIQDVCDACVHYGSCTNHVLCPNNVFKQENIKKEKVKQTCTVCHGTGMVNDLICTFCNEGQFNFQSTFGR